MEGLGALAGGAKPRQEMVCCAFARQYSGRAGYFISVCLGKEKELDQIKNPRQRVFDSLNSAKNLLKLLSSITFLIFCIRFRKNLRLCSVSNLMPSISPLLNR